MMLQRYNKKARLQNGLAFFCCFLFNIGFDGFNGFFLCFKPQTTQKDAKIIYDSCSCNLLFLRILRILWFISSSDLTDVAKEYLCNLCHPLTTKT